MLGNLQTPRLQLPGVVTIAVVLLQGTFRRRTDLFRLLELALGHARLHLGQGRTYPLHRLAALPFFVGATLVAIDHKHAYPGTVAADFLHTRPRPVSLLTSVDAHRTVDPLRFVHAIDQRLRFR